jgi:hypothetical protein
MIRRAFLTLAAAGAVFALGGCYIDDDCRFCGDLTEIIRYENRTDFLVDNFIDGRYVGTVPRLGVLEVEGDYEGRRLFESESTEGDLVWGPTELRVRDGELLVLQLTEDGGFKVSTQPRPSR